VRAGYRLLLCDLGVEERLREQRLVELIVAVPAVQRGALYCNNALQRGALCCNALQRGALCCNMLPAAGRVRCGGTAAWCQIMLNTTPVSDNGLSGNGLSGNGPSGNGPSGNGPKRERLKGIGP
jgi:hypothetical protein